MTSNTITHALISVSNKTGILPFAKDISDLGIVILSTGGTAKLLRENNIPVLEVSDFTHFPEIMNGRVKTLHPKIFAGILARPSMDNKILDEYHFPTIGLVVVNLYPFQETIREKHCKWEEAIENIDIGGPSLLRAGAKNYETTTVITDQSDYNLVLTELKENLETSLETRFKLAQKVFTHVANYDFAISQYFCSKADNKTPFPQSLNLHYVKKLDLRYGENPHQEAAFYIDPLNQNSKDISTFKIHCGKPLSYNNLLDADTALECVRQFQETACVIVKHANPCAVAISSLSQEEAYKKAYQSDPTSSFGGILALNTKLEADTLQTILANQFAELIIAPDVSEEALSIAKQKPNLRILTVGELIPQQTQGFDLLSVTGGLLIQDKDSAPTGTDFTIVSKRSPTEEEMGDLHFAWQVVRFTKSNAIVFAKHKATLGIGAGQMSRVFSTKIAALKANEANISLQNAVMASDAFFPFRDSIDTAWNLGIRAIIQPGGSIRDEEIIQAANEHDLAMVFTHRRHFRH